MKLLVLTVMGPDRPGLVESLSEILATHGGNWEESRMARLAGQFAGILTARVPAARTAALTQELQGSISDDLRITVEMGAEDIPLPPSRALHLELIGQDHPGIVRDISHALASQGINIDELDTHCSSASMSGETLFHAAAQLRIPKELPTEQLRSVLEGLANELMVDITLDEENL
jgi:glycine cleavage system regulatory protein